MGHARGDGEGEGGAKVEGHGEGKGGGEVEGDHGKVEREGFRGEPGLELYGAIW